MDKHAGECMYAGGGAAAIFHGEIRDVITEKGKFFFLVRLSGDAFTDWV